MERWTHGAVTASPRVIVRRVAMHWCSRSAGATATIACSAAPTRHITRRRGNRLPIVGFGGNDDIRGDGDADILVGGDLASAGIVPIDRWETSTRDGLALRNDIALNAVPIDLSSGGLGGLTLHDGDNADWYLLPLPSGGGPLAASDFQVVFDSGPSQTVFDHPLYQVPHLSVVPAQLDPTDGKSYVPTTGAADAYLLRVRNPRSLAIAADGRPRQSELSGPTLVTLRVSIDGGVARSIPVTVDGSMSGGGIADAINASIVVQGLGANLFAEYDSQLDRLLISARREQSLTISGDFASGLHHLGFVSGQSNQESAASLGGYTLKTNRVFPASIASGMLPVRIAETPIARPDTTFIPPRPLIDLSSGTQSVAAAQRIEGAAAFERMSQAAAIGDVNGDGLADTILWGNQRAYVVLSDLDPQRSVTPIGDVADYVVPLDGGWRPVAGGADLDGDGRAETAFWRIAEPNRIELGILPGGQLNERDVNFDRLVTQVAVLPLSGEPSGVDIAWMHFNDDGLSDLMVIARQPLVTRGSDSGYGGVLDGTWLRDAINNQAPAAGPFQMSLWINGSSQSHTTVLAVVAGVRGLADRSGCR
jgi:hypothetical protein